MNIPSTYGVYVISDCNDNIFDDLMNKTEKILNAGISLFQFRDKYSDQEIKRSKAINLYELCKKYNTPFIINDDVQLAKEISADGVHLGKNDMNIIMARKVLGDKIIGVSCYNNLENAISAEKRGADYVAFGSFFNSPTKPDAEKADTKLLVAAKSELNIPIVAIGGITPENGKILVDKKVNYLAIVSGIYTATNIVDKLNTYKSLFY